MTFISISITTEEGNKTIGFISDLKEFESAVKMLREKAKEVLK